MESFIAISAVAAFSSPSSSSSSSLLTALTSTSPSSSSSLLSALTSASSSPPPPSSASSSSSLLTALISASASGSASSLTSLLKNSSTCHKKSSSSSSSPLLHTIPQAEAEIIATRPKYLRPRTPPHDIPNGKDPAMVSQSVDQLSFAQFLTLIRSADPLIRTLPVIAIETYETKTLHQYSIVTIQLPKGKRTYVKLELQVDEVTSGATIIKGGGATILTALLTDDPSNLILPHDHSVAKIEFTPNSTQGPSLDALAALLDIIYKRVGKYDLYGRNCLWFTDLIFYGTAMKFKEACLAGRLVPDEGIRNYLREGKRIFTASTQWIQRVPGLMETFKRFVAVGRMVTFDMDSEVEDVVEKWQHYMDAAPIV